MVTVVLLGAIAVAGGGVGVALGPIPGDGVVGISRAADSEYRFLSGTWLCWGVAALWSARRPGRRALVTRLFLVAAILGGVARLVSLLSVGWPGPLLTAALGIELLVVPLVLLWHLRHYPPGGTAD
ncbi:MAG: DUF4345 domain-containing protein [Propionibacteriaceae bacterium]